MSSLVRNTAPKPSATQLSEFDWVVRIVMGIYILLAPVCVFLPPALGVNPLRFLGAIVAILALGSLFLPSSRISLRVWLLFALAFIYMLTILTTDALSLVMHIHSTFGTIMFFVFLILLVRKPCDNITWWFYLIIAASVVAFMVSLSVRIGLIGVPSYRLAIAKLFILDRTASIVDTSIGIWGLIASLYIVAERQGWKRGVGYVGIIVSLGTVAMGQFRSYLICCVLILLIAFWFKSLKRIRIPLVTLALAFLVFLAIDPATMTESSLWRRFQHLSVSTESGALRWRAWEREIEVKLIKEKPFVGHGWRVAEEHEVGTGHLGKVPLFGHCFYTAMPTRIGIPLATLFILPLFLLLIMALKYAWKANSTSTQNLYLMSAIAVGSLLLVCLVQNLPSMANSFPVFAIFAWPMLRPLTSEPAARYATQRFRGWRGSCGSQLSR